MTQKVGVRIKSRREELGLTQQQLAESLGVARETVARWETGERTPPALSLTAIALALQWPADGLRFPRGK